MKWINIKDQMPKENEWVLITVQAYDDPFMVVAFYDKHRNCWDSGDNDFDNGDDVNWWTALPLLPKPLRKLI